MTFDRIVYTTLGSLFAVAAWGFWQLRKLDRIDYTPREVGR